jgi:hypothetical protein
MKSPSLIIAQSSLELGKEDITVVMPIFNQSDIILRNLTSLVDSLDLKARIILIDDASSDASSDLIAKSLVVLCAMKPLAVELYKFKKSKFETHCDKFGMSLARTKYVIEVQADMQVKDKGFDSRLVACMNSHPDLIAVSGRGVEPLSEPLDYFLKTAGSVGSKGRSVLTHIIVTLFIRLTPGGFLRIAQAVKGKLFRTPAREPIQPLSSPTEDFACNGRAGISVSSEELALESSSKARLVLVGETVMRGPIIMDREKYEEVGGFDSGAFFLGFDDHDLVLRGRMNGYGCGYSFVHFLSPEADGTTRKPRTWKSELEILFELIRISRRRRKSALSLYSRGRISPPEVVHHTRRF